MLKKIMILTILSFLASCGNSQKDAEIELPKTSTGTTEVKQEIASNIKGKYEELPQKHQDDIKQMVDVVVMYIIQKGLPESGSGELSEAEKKEFFNKELVLGIDEEIVPAYPNVDFSGMKETILGKQ